MKLILCKRTGFVGLAAPGFLAFINLRSDVDGKPVIAVQRGRFGRIFRPLGK